jgi:hypothetical protein
LAQNYVILVGILWSDMAVSGLIKWSNGWITCPNFLSLCLYMFWLRPSDLHFNMHAVR